MPTIEYITLDVQVEHMILPEVEEPPGGCSFDEIASLPFAMTVSHDLSLRAFFAKQSPGRTQPPRANAPLAHPQSCSFPDLFIPLVR